jgi:hypothetical protein
LSFVFETGRLIQQKQKIKKTKIMKKFIQNAFSRLLLLSTFTLLGLTSFGQFNYVPGTVYTFRTLISSTQAVQMDIVYDGNENATVTLTQVTPQAGDKVANHIFLPEINDHSRNQSTNELNIISNSSNYKIIDVTTGTSTDFPTGYVIVSSCDNGCETGGGGCTLKGSFTDCCWVQCCEDDSADPVCTKCNKPTNKIVNLGITYQNPLLIIRVAGALTIQ